MQINENITGDFIKDAPNTGIDLSPSLDKYEPIRIRKEKPVKVRDSVITWGPASIATPANILALSGASGIGKSAAMSILIAGAISCTGDVDGLDEIKVMPNKSGKAVLHFDSEQSPEDHYNLLNIILRRADLTNTPEYLYSYNCLQFTVEEYQPFTNEVCKIASSKHGGIHSIFVDGGAEFLSDTNDLKESQAAVRFFRNISIQYDCPVIVIIHTNPNGTKERGHFGSVLQRASYALITIEKKGDISTMIAKKFRRAGLSDVQPVSFIYSKEKNYHVQIDGTDAAPDRDQKELLKVKKIAEEVFAPPKSLPYKKAIDEIKEASGKGLTTAKDMLRLMRDEKLIIKGADDNYRMAI